MRVFNEEKTKELKNFDTELGRLLPDKLVIAHHEAVEAVPEQGHYEEKTYPNGGKSKWWVIDTPAVEARDAYDEYEDIRVFVPYTEKELAEREIRALKRKLAETDYRAIKYAEGVLSEEEYAPDKAQRQAWRDRIGELSVTLGVTQ